MRSHKIHISPKKQLFWIYASFFIIFWWTQKIYCFVKSICISRCFFSPKLKTFGLQCLKFKSRKVSESSERNNLIWKIMVLVKTSIGWIQKFYSCRHIWLFFLAFSKYCSGSHNRFSEKNVYTEQILHQSTFGIILSQVLSWWNFKRAICHTPRFPPFPGKFNFGQLVAQVSCLNIFWGFWLLISFNYDDCKNRASQF